jgi:hypothetical protein
MRQCRRLTLWITSFDLSRCVVSRFASSLHITLWDRYYWNWTSRLSRGQFFPSPNLTLSRQGWVSSYTTIRSALVAVAHIVLPISGIPWPGCSLSPMGTSYDLISWWVMNCFSVGKFSLNSTQAFNLDCNQYVRTLSNNGHDASHYRSHLFRYDSVEFRHERHPTTSFGLSENPGCFPDICCVYTGWHCTLFHVRV